MNNVSATTVIGPVIVIGLNGFETSDELKPLCRVIFQKRYVINVEIGENLKSLEVFLDPQDSRGLAVELRRLVVRYCHVFNGNRRFVPICWRCHEIGISDNNVWSCDGCHRTLPELR